MRNKWKQIVKQKKARVPFKKEYCGCGKRTFRSMHEASRYRLAEIRDTKKKAHIYQCPVSFDWHLTYKTS